MSIHFHPLQVREVRRETPDCVSVAFDVPDQLSEVFKFRQGQNITLKANFNGEEIRRSYSICTAPTDNELRIAIKEVPDGRFSGFANNQLQAGDTVEVLPPTGNFHAPLNAAQKKNYLAFAAGSGITPILSIIRTTLATESQSEFTLVYGNRNRASIIFREQLEALKNKYLNRFRILHILSREATDATINSGRINAEKCRQLAGGFINWDTVDQFFLCGPEAMIFSVRDYLEENGISGQKIHFELFNTPGQDKTAQKTAVADPGAEGPVSEVTVKLDGISFRFKLGFGSQSILDAALLEGADLPYACKGGVCSTCRARLVSGKVEMDQNFALEPEELAKGFILTCQSHPRTPSILVDFDDRN